MPTEWDENNIRRSIESWNRRNPRGKIRYLQDPNDPRRIYVEYLNIYDHLDYMRSVVKKERKLSAILPGRKGDPMHLLVSLPPGYAAELHKGYPTMLTDKRQTEWFLRKFPEFKLD